jgi:hypothetical protein
VVEEFNGDRRSELILVPEGRAGKGWELFGSELRRALEYFRAGSRTMVAVAEVQAGKEKRRSYAEVLAKSLPPLEEPFGDISGPVARVPRWVKGRSEGRHTNNMTKIGIFPAVSKQRFLVSAKDSLGPRTVTSAPVSIHPAEHAVSNCAEKTAAEGCGSSDRNFLLGDSFGLFNLKRYKN